MISLLELFSQERENLSALVPSMKPFQNLNSKDREEGEMMGWESSCCLSVPIFA
jgi:hypothetical protein